MDGLVELDAPYATIARGVNSQGNVVGWGYPLPPCQSRAVYWPSVNEAPVNIGELYTVGGQVNPTRAEAIQDVAPYQIVGQDTTDLKAVLWEPNGAGSWDAFDLNDLISEGCGCAPEECGCPAEACGWVLRFAHDINSNGWIICLGETESGDGPQHALLLVPIAQCPSGQSGADLNGDGEVNVVDLLALLAEWCDGCCPCIANVAGACDSVNTVDLLALLGQWGAECAGGGEIPQTVDDCLDRFELGSLELEKCLEAVSEQQ